MTKPWGEEWEQDENWPEYVAHSGVNIAKFREGAWDPTPHDEARARLASKAPKMARELLGLLEEDGHIEACGNGGSDPEDCSPKCFRLRALLHEAGVLE